MKIKKIEPLKNPRFIEPVRIFYEIEGERVSWEAVRSHDSVAILIYHTQKDAFVLVRQPRPALLMAQGVAYTYELCAGIVDKDKSLEQIAMEEVEEETGYVPQKLERVTSFYTSVGFAGARQTLYYAEVDESMRKSAGGGVDGERIEVVFLPVAEAESFMFDESKPKTPGLLFAFCWWLRRRGR